MNNKIFAKTFKLWIEYFLKFLSVLGMIIIMNIPNANGEWKKIEDQQGRLFFDPELGVYYCECYVQPYQCGNDCVIWGGS